MSIFNTKQLKYLFLVSIFVLFQHLSASELIVTPLNSYGWHPANVRADSSVALTTTNPRVGQISGLGDSSIEFITNFVTTGQDKADYELIWQAGLANFSSPPLAITGAFTFPNRTLMNLSAVGYDYYRDSVGSATIGVSIHPSLRLFWYDTNGSTTTIDDTYGFFIYELADSGPTPITTDTWVNNDLLNTGIFWVFCLKCNPAAVGGATLGRISRYDKTLIDWRSGGPSPIIINTQPEAPNFSLGNTYLVGANTGVGSGWNNDLVMYVDNIHLAFGANDDTVYNFENDRIPFTSPLPIPMLSWWVMLLLILGILLVFSRKPIQKR